MRLKILKVLCDLVDFDYSVSPLIKDGPAQDARNLEPKLNPNEPSLKSKEKKKNRVKEYLKEYTDGR